MRSRIKTGRGSRNVIGKNYGVGAGEEKQAGNPRKLMKKVSGVNLFITKR
jgi:hypothetical protein